MCDYHSGKPCPTYHDYIGRKIKVVSKNNREHLFSLGVGPEVEAFWFDVNCAKIQWFEPECSNYYRLAERGPQLLVSQNVLHTSWQKIADFAEQKKGVMAYVQEGGGDWKSQPDGGQKSVLATINGQPYWPDAVGQIPYAVNAYKHFARKALDRGETLTSNDKERLIKTVLGYGQTVGDGSPVSALKTQKRSYDATAVKLENHYDNYLILRGALWAAERYDITQKMDARKSSEYSSSYDSQGRIQPSVARTIRTATNYAAENLGRPISRDLAIRYGLKS